MSVAAQISDIPLQESLFDCAEHKPNKAVPKKPSHKTSTVSGTQERVEQTLFGPVENKAAARRRAQRISQLLSAIEAAPEIIEYRTADIEVLQYFIERSEKVTLTVNDLDCLQRFVDTSELLTEADWQQMKRRKIWRRYPRGWLGALRGERYPAALHKKEVRYLRDLQKECREEISAVRTGVEVCTAELEALRGVCPIPPEIAERYQLTPDGYRLQPNG